VGFMPLARKTFRCSARMAINYTWQPFCSGFKVQPLLSDWEARGECPDRNRTRASGLGSRFD
jgi:hypothetical protein